MEIRDRLYPYPILANFRDDYVDSSFDVSVNVNIDKSNIELVANYTLINDEIWDLIVDDKAKILVHLECPTTSFREVFELEPNGSKISFKSGMLNNELQVCSFIVANQDIMEYNNEYFNEVYSDMSFNIYKHNILAIGTPMSIPIEKDYDDIRNISSIFTVMENLDKNEKVIQRDFYQDKIYIKIPKQQFDKYKISIQNPLNHSYMHAMLIIPILIEIIESLKTDDTWGELEDRKWFKALGRTLRKKQFEFTENTVKNVNTFAFVQQIMDSPILTSLENLFIQSTISAGDDDEN
jgi:hypothetical protein